MTYLGFDTHYPGDVRWEVRHNTGTTFVTAPSEAIAIQRFLAKYPDKIVKRVERK